jgi:hypothetical protein
VTRDEQLDWLHARQYKDPQWATREYDIRRQAAEVMDRLYEDDEPGYIKVAVFAPGDGPFGMNFREVSIYKHDVVRVGGLEGILIVEEMLRRAMGLSREQELETRLETIRKAV